MSCIVNSFGARDSATTSSEFASKRKSWRVFSEKYGLSHKTRLHILQNRIVSYPFAVPDICDLRDGKMLSGVVLFPVIPQQFAIFRSECLFFLHSKRRDERDLLSFCTYADFIFSAAFRQIYVSAEILSRKFIPKFMYHICISVHKKNPAGGKTIEKRGYLSLISMRPKAQPARYGSGPDM